MTIKSIYHKTDEMGSFEGQYFYMQTHSISSGDKIYVISSRSFGAELNPHLEGSFLVKNVHDGHYEKNHKKFKFRADLETIVKPSQPIDIAFIREKIGRRAFASRFMNEVKPILTGSEIEEFEKLLEHVTEAPVRSLNDDEILIDDMLGIMQSETEREQSVLARIGQGKFRKNVVKTWGLEKEVCMLTGLHLPPILTASHIVPWHECTGENARMRLDGANGILLCAHIDRLFDRYLISFKKHGMSCSVQYSKSLSSFIKNQLLLTNDLELVPNQMGEADRERFFGYIEAHYRKFLELETDAAGL